MPSQPSCHSGGGVALAALTSLSQILATPNADAWSNWPEHDSPTADDDPLPGYLPRFVARAHTLDELRERLAGVDIGAIRVAATVWTSTATELDDIRHQWRTGTMASWDALEPTTSVAVDVADAVAELDTAMDNYAAGLRRVGELLAAVATALRATADGVDDLAVDRVTTLSQVRRTVPEALLRVIDGFEDRARQVVADTYESALPAVGGDR